MRRHSMETSSLLGTQIGISFGWIAFWTPIVEDMTKLKLMDETSMLALKAWFNTFLNVPQVEKICLMRNYTYFIYRIKF